MPEAYGIERYSILSVSSYSKGTSPRAVTGTGYYYRLAPLAPDAHRPATFWFFTRQVLGL